MPQAQIPHGVPPISRLPPPSLRMYAPRNRNVPDHGSIQGPEEAVLYTRARVMDAYHYLHEVQLNREILGRDVSR